MTLERYRAPVVQLDGAATVLEAAQAMRDRRVGCIVVTRAGRPQAVVTDRDLVVRVLAEGQDGEARLEDCVTYDPLTAHVTDDVASAVATMRAHGVRRLPVVDADGLVVGMVTADDLLAELGLALGELCEGIANNVEATESR